LTGNLDPLWVTFASDQIIYPMRPTALAQGELPVYLYVLAEHRVAPPAPFAEDGRFYPLGWFTVPYAQWVEPAALEQDSPLAPFVQRRQFLTKFNIYLTNPAEIAGDFVFPFAARDTTYHHVDVHYVSADDPRAAAATSEGSGWTLISLALFALGLMMIVWLGRIGLRRLE
jgi:hypothetical protein